MGADAVQHGPQYGSLAEELVGQAAGALVGDIILGHQQYSVYQDGDKPGIGKTQHRRRIDDDVVKLLPELR